MSTFKRQIFVGKYPWKYNIYFSKFFNTEKYLKEQIKPHRQVQVMA